MSIRYSLLAILDTGSCYGYQLRLEFDRRTGGTWPLNVGQVYSTLDRLERDGLVATGQTDSEGHVFYDITDAGRSVARRWLETPVERPSGTRDEFAVKLAISITLQGADAPALIAAQRSVTEAALANLRAESGGSEVRVLVIESMILGAEAELRWLDHCDSVVTATNPFGLTDLLPKRGRPVQAKASRQTASRASASR